MELEALNRKAAADNELNWVTATFMALFHLGAVAALFFFTWRAFFVAAAAQGAHMVVGFVPAAFRVLHTFCKFPPESVVGKWTVNDMPERLAKALRSRSPGVGFLDLTPALIQATEQGAVPYYRDDEHWSEAGHRVAAGALNAYLGGPQYRSER